ncbi:MAG: EamA family transporter [Candidatus Niyogibacteria bacterium]|nr:EamA family transporter [Candidatus Niyogibacteria bacterium]
MSNWLIFVMLAIIFWGLGSVAGKFIGTKSTSNLQLALHGYFGEAIGTIVMAALIVFVVLVVLTLVASSKNQSFSFLTFDYNVIYYSLAMGALWSIGTFFFLLALRQQKSVVVVPFTSLYPVVHVLFAILILGEKLTVKEWMGLLCAVATVYLFTSTNK